MVIWTKVTLVSVLVFIWIHTPIQLFSLSSVSRLARSEQRPEHKFQTTQKQPADYGVNFVCMCPAQIKNLNGRFNAAVSARPAVPEDTEILNCISGVPTQTQKHTQWRKLKAEFIWSCDKLIAFLILRQNVGHQIYHDTQCDAGSLLQRIGENWFLKPKSCGHRCQWCCKTLDAKLAALITIPLLSLPCQSKSWSDWSLIPRHWRADPGLPASLLRPIKCDVQKVRNACCVFRFRAASWLHRSADFVEVYPGRRQNFDAWASNLTWHPMESMKTMVQSVPGVALKF